jgi:AraC-like DNA-binding protein
MKYEPKRDVEQRVSNRTLYNVSSCMHFHRSIELNYALEGAIKVQLGLKMEIFHANEIAFVPPYVPHAVGAIGNTVSENLIIPYRYFQKFAQEKIPLQYFRLNNKEINEKLFAVINEIKNLLLKKNEILLQAYIDILLGTIADRYPSEDSAHANNGLIIEIIEYIEENFKNDLTLDSLAAHFHYDKYYFSKLFNASFHCNLKTYINRVRFHYVNDRLHSKKNLTTLILEAGFKDISTYYRVRRSLSMPACTPHGGKLRL